MEAEAAHRHNVNNNIAGWGGAAESGRLYGTLVDVEMKSATGEMLSGEEEEEEEEEPAASH